jgi:nucleotide-binding universal stress UspA family protein
VDLQAQSGPVLDWASHLADEYQASLTLLHVTPEIESAYLTRPNREEMVGRSKLDDLLRDAGIYATVRVDAGQPAKTIACVAREIGADLVVIGRRAAPAAAGRLEANAYAIIRQSPCPVVSV